MHPLQAVIDIVNPPKPVKTPEEINHTSYLEKAGFHTTHTWEGFYDSEWGLEDRAYQLVELVKVYAEWLNDFGNTTPWFDFRKHYDATPHESDNKLTDEDRYYSLVIALGNIAEHLRRLAGDAELMAAIIDAGTQALAWLAYEHEHSPDSRAFWKSN